MGILDDAEAGAHLVGPVLKLGIHALLDLFKTGIAIQTSGIGSKMSAQCAAPAPAGAVWAAVKAAASVEHHLHHLGGVDIGGVVPAIFPARQADLHTAHHAVVAGFLQCHSLAQHAFDRSAVVEKLGVAVAGADALYRLDAELFRGSLMHPHTDPRVHHPGMGRGFQHQHGQIVGGVGTVPLHATNGQALAAKAPAIAQRHAAPVLELGGVIELDILHFQQFQRKLFGEAFVRLIIGVKPLVHPSIGDGVAVRLHTDEHRGKVEQLQCLPEGLWRTACHSTAVRGDLFQLGLSSGFLLPSRHFLCQHCIPQDVFFHSAVHDDDRLIELPLGAELGVVHIQRRQFFLSPLQQTVKAQLHQAGVIHRQMTCAGVVVEIGLVDLFARLRALELVLVQTDVDIIVQRAALPPTAQLQDLLLFLFAADGKLVMLPLLKGVVLHFVQDPVDREFRVDGGRFDGRSDLAHNEVVVVDLYAAVQQHIFKGVSNLLLFGQIFVLPVTLGDKAQTLHVHVVAPIQKRLAQFVDAGIGGPVLMMDLIAQTVNFIIRLGAACVGVDSCHNGFLLGAMLYSGQFSSFSRVPTRQ